MFFFLYRIFQFAVLLERFTVQNQAGNFQGKYKKNFLSLTGNTCSLDLTGEISHCRCSVMIFNITSRKQCYRNFCRGEKFI